MNRFKRTFTLLLTVALLFSGSSLAHSGRTDPSGGHRDNRNVSGLGYYHYHHGYPAHLHPNGICPYRSQTTTPSSSTSTSVSVSRPAPKPKTGIVACDVRTFINGAEIPTFAYNGNPNVIVVIAEDLGCYGFDLGWDSALRTITITKNSAKPISPIDMTYYRGLSAGTFLWNVIDSPVYTVLKEKPEDYGYSLGTVYNLNGYTAIPVDELSAFGQFLWNGEDRLIDILIP